MSLNVLVGLTNSNSVKAVHTISFCQPDVGSERNPAVGVEFCASPSNITTDSKKRIASQRTCDTEGLCKEDTCKNVTSSSLQSLCRPSINLLQVEEIDYNSNIQNKREKKPLPTSIYTTVVTSRDIDAFALKRNVCAEKAEDDKKSNAFEVSLSRDQPVIGVMSVTEIANFKEQEALQENGFSIDYFLERTQESSLRQSEVAKTYFLQDFQPNFSGENTYSFDGRRSNTSVVNMCDQTSIIVDEAETEKNSSDKNREKVAKNNEIPGLPQSITWNLPSDVGFLNSHTIISPHFLRAPLFYSPPHLYPFVPLPAPIFSPQIVPLPPAVAFAGGQASYISELSQIDYFRRRPPPCFWITNRSTCSKPEIEEVCNRQFETISEIVYHISDMHLNSLNNSTGNSNEQYYYCFWKDCLRSMKPFRARYKLVNHIRVHTGERPFLCHFPSCGKRFARSENLKIHKRVHSGERPFICEYSSCSRRFTNSSDRKKHMHTHTTEKELDSITRPKKLSKQLTKHSRKRLSSDEDIQPNIYVKNETLKQEKSENFLRENYQMMNSPSCVNSMLSIKSHAIIQDLENSVNHHLHQVGEKTLIN